MKKNEKEFLRQYYEKVWHNSEKMVAYCLGESDEYAKLDNGGVIVFEKPRIQTDFCFGYSLSSCNTESYDNANDMVEHARNDVEYFINENMKEIRSFDPEKKYLAFRKYDDSEIYYCVSVDDYICNERYFKGEPIYLNDEEIKRIAEAYERYKNNFVKRINTYLKKYGLSKVHTWSYWRDE